MLRIKIFFLFLLMLLFNSCGATATKDNSVRVLVDAGRDKIVKVNTLLSIEGKGTSSDSSQLLYEWKKNNEVLGTSSTLQYTPTVLGVDTLEFFVKHKSGEIVSDIVKVTVIEVQNHIKIATISSLLVQQYLKSINDARAKNQDCGEEGLFPATTSLEWNTKLYKSSYEHSYDMVYSKTFSHTGSGTKSDWTGNALGRKSILSERIDAYTYNWSFIGENIGAGTLIDSPKKMVDGWLASDAHCANLMSPNFEEVGMAMIKKSDAKYTHYWTQNFGTQK